MRKSVSWSMIIAVVALIGLCTAGCAIRGPVILGTMDVVLTQYRGGPAIQGALVKVLDGLTLEVVGQAESNKEGRARVALRVLPDHIAVVCTKYGYALSVIEGLKPSVALSQPTETIMRRADLFLDPSTQNPFLPVEFRFFYPPEWWGDEPIIIDPAKPITEDFSIEARILDAPNHIHTIYPPQFGRVPGDHKITGDGAWPIENSSVAEFENITIDGLDGISDLHFIIYDYNGNRFHRIVYLDIQPHDPTVFPDNPYQPIPAASIGVPNIMAFTRCLGIDFFAAQRAAPQNANLLTGVFFVDHQSAQRKELIGLDVPKPDGYRIYRSWDGVQWSPLGYVSSSKVDGKLSWETQELLQNQPGSFFQSHVSMIDNSSLLEAGKAVFYAVASVYGLEETEKTLLGRVIPLDPFGIDLIHPAQNQTQVSRQPEFQFCPDPALSSEMGAITYGYRVFVYDHIHDSDHWIIPVDVDHTHEPYHGIIIQAQHANPISLPFRGHEPFNGIVWFSFFDGQLEPLWTVYPWDRLEAHKTYSWGVNLAYAQVVCADQTSMAFSIAADYHPYRGRFGFDPIPDGMPPDWMIEFTTGTD